MSIDWSSAPFDAEAGTEKSVHYFAAWYRRDGNGQVQQICPEAGIEEWMWMGGRKDFPEGSKLRPPANEMWNGEGLPPVGTVCHCGTHNREVEILKVELVPFISAACQATDNSELFWGGEFSAVRTAEQIAAAQRVSDIETIMRDTDYILDEIHAAAVIAAGYRKPEAAQ